MIIIIIDHAFEHRITTVNDLLATDRLCGKARSPDRYLRPEQNSVLIKQIDKELRIRIMRSSDRVAPEILDNANIPHHKSRGESKSKFRMLLVTVDSAELNHLAVQQQLQNYEETIAKIKANSADRTGQVEMSHLQDSLKDYVLTAPASGTVTKLSIQEGETVASNTAAAVISGLDTMVVKVKIDEYSVMSTEVGMPVKIYLDAVKAVYDGTIRYISNTAEETSGVSYYNAEVTFTPDEKIRPGMSTEVRLLKVNEPDADCLYAFAVQYRPDGSTYVYVKSGEDKEERDVTVGPSDGEYVQILSGLSAEETVLAPYPENPYKYGSEITIG